MKKTLITVGTVAVMTFGGVFVADQNVAHANTELNNVQNEQSDVKTKMSKAETEIAGILKEMEKLNKEVNRLQAALEANDKEIKKNKKAIKKNEEEIVQLEAKIEERVNILKDRISANQDNGGKIKFLDVIMGSENFLELISRANAQLTIMNSDSDLAQKIEDDKKVYEEKVEELKNAKEELVYNQKMIKTQKSDLDTKTAKLETEESKVNKKLSKLKNKSSELAALEKDIKDSIAAQERAIANNNSASSSSNSSVTTTNTASSSSNSSNKTKQKAEKKVAYTGGGGSAISAGQQYIGNSTYQLGASNPAAGLFDCSSFVQWAYAQEGVSLPRTSQAQANAGTRVSFSNAQPGDLVFFDNAGHNGHVGIYLGGGKFLGAQTSTGVAVASVNDPYYWGKHFNGTVVRVK